jgi:4-oxalocrotonate tautomerase
MRARTQQTTDKLIKLNQEYNMPTINVQMFERSAEQKRAFVKAVTDAACTTLACSPESVDIIITEVKRENWSTAGRLWSDPPEN